MSRSNRIRLLESKTTWKVGGNHQPLYSVCTGFGERGSPAQTWLSQAPPPQLQGGQAWGSPSSGRPSSSQGFGCQASLLLRQAGGGDTCRPPLSWGPRVTGLTDVQYLTCHGGCAQVRYPRSEASPAEPIPSLWTCRTLVCFARDDEPLSAGQLWGWESVCLTGRAPGRNLT